VIPVKMKSVRLDTTSKVGLLVSLLPGHLLWGPLMKDDAECLPAQAGGICHPSPA
jgi:hypothetical protein